MPKFKAQHTSYGTGLVLKEGRYRPMLGAAVEDDGIIDEVAIARVVDGEAAGGRLSSREIICVIYACARRGDTDRTIGARFGIGDKPGASRICSMRKTYGIDSANRTFEENELAALLINTGQRAKASAAKLAAAGIAERVAA